MKINQKKAETNSMGSHFGFTLFEVIAALTLSAVLVAFLLPFLGSGLSGTRQAKLRMPAAHALRGQMDFFWHKYREMEPKDLQALSLIVDQAAGVHPPPPFTLIANEWMDVDATRTVVPAASGTTPMLKVTIESSQSERLTAYFLPSS